jgi:hypothetical protein
VYGNQALEMGQIIDFQAIYHFFFMIADSHLIKYWNQAINRHDAFQLALTPRLCAVTPSYHHPE